MLLIRAILRAHGTYACKVHSVLPKALERRIAGGDLSERRETASRPLGENFCGFKKIRIEVRGGEEKSASRQLPGENF